MMDLQDYRRLDRLERAVVECVRKPGWFCWLALWALILWHAFRLYSVSERLDALEAKPPAVATEAGK